MKKKVIAVILFCVLISFIPFPTILVPEWKVQVVDENGNPYKNKLVRQFCDNYTLGVHPCEEAGDFMKLTDENGYVVFPERKVWLSLTSRLIRSFLNLLMLLAHGSYGVSIYLDSSGPQGYKTLKYKSGENLPEKFVLPSKVSENEK